MSMNPDSPKGAEPAAEWAHTGPAEPDDADLRALAVRSLMRKRQFKTHLFAYLVVNALLWMIWAVTAAASGQWFPWPIFPLLGWGVGMAFHAWSTYGERPISPSDIDREVARLRGRSQ